MSRVKLRCPLCGRNHYTTSDIYHQHRRQYARGKRTVKAISFSEPEKVNSLDLASDGFHTSALSGSWKLVQMDHEQYEDNRSITIDILLDKLKSDDPDELAKAGLLHNYGSSAFRPINTYLHDEAVNKPYDKRNQLQLRKSLQSESYHDENMKKAIGSLREDQKPGVFGNEAQLLQDLINEIEGEREKNSVEPALLFRGADLYHYVGDYPYLDMPEDEVLRLLQDKFPMGERHTFSTFLSTSASAKVAAKPMFNGGLIFQIQTTRGAYVDPEYGDKFGNESEALKGMEGEAEVIIGHSADFEILGVEKLGKEFVVYLRD